MAWQPIENLPYNWPELASSELPPLVTVWNEQADRLRQSGEFQTFGEKLRREIAIETGIIERLYTFVVQCRPDVCVTHSILALRSEK